MFVVSLRGLNTQETTRCGNLLGLAGMSRLPLSQRQLGDLASVSQRVLSLMGAHLPALEGAERLARGPGARLARLAYGKHGRHVFHKIMAHGMANGTGPQMRRQALARAAHVGNTTIYNLEMGRTVPLANLCKALAVSHYSAGQR